MTWKFFPWRSLNTRVTLFTLAIFLAGIWSLAFYASRMLRADMQRLLGEQQFSTVSFIAAQINSELDERFRALDMVAGRVSPAMLGNTATLQAHLENSSVLQILFNAGAFATRLDGTAIADVPRSAGRAGLDFMGRDHVAAALKEGKATVGRPVIGRKLQAPVVGMTVPLRDAQGKVIGALTGVSDLGVPNFLDHISQGRYGASGGFLLIAPRYRLIVTASDKSRIMEVLPAPGVNPTMDRFVQGYEGSAVYVNPVGVEVLASAKGVPVAGWNMAAMLPTAEAFAPINDMQRRMLVAAIFLTLLAGVLSWWMLRRQLAPLLATVKTLATLADSGQPTQPLPITRQDEIGELIGGFNRLLLTLAQREQALLESEARFRAVVESSPEAISVHRDGKRIYANSAAIKLYGATSEQDLVGKPVLDLIHPDFRPMVQARLRNMSEHGGGAPLAEMKFLKLDGTTIDVEVQSTSIAYGGKPANHVFIRDITERKLAALALSRQKDLYAMLSQTNQTIVRSSGAGELFEEVCRIAVEHGRFVLAWIGLLDADQHLVPVARHGKDADYADYPSGLRISMNESDPWGRGIIGQALRSGRCGFNNEILGDTAIAPWQVAARRVGVRALASLPLRRGGAVIGALSVYSNEPGFFSEDLLATLDEMAADISFALDNFEREAERQRMEEALRAAEEQFRSLTAMSSDFYWQSDAEHRLLARGLGSKPAIVTSFANEAQVGLRRWEIPNISPDEAGWQAHRAVLDAHQPFRHFELSRRGPDGSVRHVLVSGNPLFDASAMFKGYVGVGTDVTERKQADKALREREERLRVLFDRASDGIMISSSSGKIVAVNESFAQMHGYTKEEMQTQDVKDLNPHVRPEHERRRRIFSGEFKTFEVEHYHKDGHVFPLEVSASLIISDGEPLIQSFHRDISERKRAEAAHASLEAQLRESQKMEAVGTLAGGIAHDFNNILATVLGNAELARQDASANPLALQSLEEIRKAASRARDLVQQILAFSRRQATERKLTALAPTLEESARLLRATLPARVLVEVHCDPDVPPVLADTIQIQQVLINLATNAMQAMRGGPGRIVIRLDTAMLDTKLADAHPALHAMHQHHPGRSARLAVSDDGSGMDAATLERIFEPFFTTKAVDQGTGLGLSVVHGIVQGHEGAIVVDSTLGKGTSFTLYLPAAQAGAPLPDQGAAAIGSATAPALSLKEGPPIGPQHILYLDDDDALVFLVLRLLERRGFRVSGYTDQREALAALGADPHQFDLVVSDYNMPGMSGLEVARAVRAIRADLPVAIASGFIDEELRAQAGGAGVRKLIFKADSAEDLCAAVARLADSPRKTHRT